MKQLTQSEIRKNGKVYKNVSSPATEGTMKQVTDIVEKDGTFSISTDGGKTYSPAGGAVPEALPQEASALKSGNLPTSGWAEITDWFWEGNIALTGNATEVFVTNIPNAYDLTSLTARVNEGSETVCSLRNTTDNVKLWETNVYSPRYIYCYKNGDIKVKLDAFTSDTYYLTALKSPDLLQQTYTISDTSITANSDILMELTDDGGVKAYSMEAGKMTVIRDTVPTQPIPYTYKVKQTNASGQFTLVNHYVPSIPVMSVNGQTGAVTIAVPTKTSELTNDSDFVTNSAIGKGTLTIQKNGANVATFGANQSENATANISVPTKTSDLTNDSGFISKADIPTTPTSLPVTYKKVSGELPISGWSTSDEGWKENTLPASRYWSSVAYGDGKYVATANSSDKGAYSTDGISWTEMSMPASLKWYSVTYGNGKFVAIASETDKGAYSADGITWTEMSMPASRNWRTITYGNGKFVAMEISSDKGAYSTDGITWTEFTLPATRNWMNVTYGDGKFVAVAYNQYGAYSTDGINWVEMTLPVNTYWAGVTYGNGKFVAVASNSSSGAYSADGINWTETTLPASAVWGGVTYGNGKFVTVAFNSDKSAYSTDGINWTETSMPVAGRWQIPIYGNEKFVVMLNNSDKGAYWKAVASSSTGKTYTISDTFITANTSVKMYLNDEGGVKAQSKANGSITVIRDIVPTTPIPYEYEVEQTSAEGLFEVINAYVPSAGEWQDWTSTSALTEEGLYEIVAEGGSNLGYTFFIQYEQGKPNNGACWVSASSTDVSVIAPQCSADGKLSVKKSLSSSGTTESLAFKYRKIN